MFSACSASSSLPPEYLIEAREDTYQIIVNYDFKNSSELKRQ